MGATRRLDHYSVASGWQPLYITMLIGGVVIMIGVGLQLAQILASIIERKRLVDTTGDPWDGRSLEWSTPSPVPEYNFTTTPMVSTRDAWWEQKQKGLAKPAFEDIHAVKNTSAGIWISLFAFMAGFGFVWEIVWLWVVSLVAIIVSMVVKSFMEDTEYIIPAADVKKREEERLKHAPKPPSAEAASMDEDMGVWDLVKYLMAFALDFVRRKRWRNL
jgi:cytochrome o ubiquinol oxidase subunit 1